MSANLLYILNYLLLNNQVSGIFDNEVHVLSLRSYIEIKFVCFVGTGEL